jgi:glucokinase
MEKLEGHFNVPVGIGNDANLAALGEWRHGAGRGSNDIIYLTISTGIGGGVITDGRLLIGSRGVGAEMGHIVIVPDGPECGCGQRGHLEAVASGTAIAREVENRLAAGEPSSLSSLGGALSAAQVGQAAQAGDPLALEVIQQAAIYIGQGLADFCHIFNPEIFVLGGGVSQLGDLLFNPIRQSLEAHLMHPIFAENLAIKPAALGDDAGLVGAMVLASQQ